MGGDDIKSLRQQVVQTKLDKSFAWINNQQDWPDVYGLGPDAVFGVFGTTWYYRLDLPGVKEFVAKYQKTYPGVQIKVPGNVFLQRLHGDARDPALRRGGRHHQQPRGDQEARGPQDGARDRMQHYDAWIDPATHQVQQTIYMASYNDKPAEKPTTSSRSSRRCRRRKWSTRTRRRPASWSRTRARPRYEQ